MDGRKLAEAALAMRPDLHIIFATGYARYAVEAEMEAQITLLNKPFRASELASTVRKAFDLIAA